MPRGRQKGQTKACRYIEDPLFGKFKIQVDENSYNIMEKDTDKTLSYHTKLSTAIKFLIRNKIVSERKTQTLGDYISDYKEAMSQFGEKFGEL